MFDLFPKTPKALEFVDEFGSAITEPVKSMREEEISANEFGVHSSQQLGSLGVDANLIPQGKVGFSSGELVRAK